MISVTIPMKLRSEANISEHWTIKRKKKNSYDLAVGFTLKTQSHKPSLPCTVTLTRIAPRELDYDNYVYSCKSLRDTIADYIIPGLARGRADGDKRIQWHYLQQKGSPKEYAVRIEIKTTNE